jgi:hypothetical protein
LATTTLTTSTSGAAATASQPGFARWWPKRRAVVGGEGGVDVGDRDQPDLRRPASYRVAADR